MKHLLDMTPGLLVDWLETQGHSKYRTGQIQEWLFQRGAESFAEMSNLPTELRLKLEATFSIMTSNVVAHDVSKDGSEKLLLQFPDRGQIECVLLRDDEIRRSICISTQIGCAMGCVFCASGLDGVDRNLTTGEMVEQMLRLQRLLPEGERLSHVIVMGVGEPLANLDQLLPALQRATDADGLNISARRITISTVGLPTAMRKLTEADARFQLAVSLHAPNDELRNQLVPVNKGTGIDSILHEADRYFERSGRRLTFEYVLLAGINDSPNHAQQLAALLKGRTAMLNLIPYNPVAGLPYQTPSANATATFCEILVGQQINVRLRRRKGDEINAACGQLRRGMGHIIET
jgi:23S rRNA (adenine2503-C2)-methyltransferase